MHTPKNSIIQSTLELLDNPSCMEKLPTVLSSGKTIRIEKLDMVRDLPIIYDWVNRPYAIPYWEMNGPFEELERACQDWLDNPDRHSFVAYLDNIMLCQLDIYETTSDILRDYYDATDSDLGIHLLMGPDKKPEGSFSTKLLLFFLHFLFCNTGVNRIVCEPDIRNRPANRLVEGLGFHLEKQISLPNKTANLYIFSRQQLLSLATV